MNSANSKSSKKYFVIITNIQIFFVRDYEDYRMYRILRLALHAASEILIDTSLNKIIPGFFFVKEHKVQYTEHHAYNITR
jgi:hypothetical protein